jgi:hypothetical protein
MRGGQNRENSFRDIAGIENRNFDLVYQESQESGSKEGRNDSTKKLIH